jgi:cytochrome c oxidase cbb3-type subunit 1
MAGTEWLDTVLSMRPYWFVRTVAGVSMDIGMTLLVIDLMMTALAKPAAAAERPAYGEAPVPAGGAA